MGRLSAPFLQAVGFCWLAHWEASRCIWNCSQYTIERGCLSETVVALHRVLRPDNCWSSYCLHLLLSVLKLEEENELTFLRNTLISSQSNKPSRYLFLALWPMVNRGHPKQQEHRLEHETIHIHLCSDVGSGLPFSITGDTWKTPRSVALTKLMNLVASRVAKSGLTDIMSSCLFAPVGGVDWLWHSRRYTYKCTMCICVWRGGGFPHGNVELFK